MVRISSDDPFASALAPPANETASEKEGRERAEAEARRISESIDEEIRQERTALKKKKKPVKVLLLGQSESGKSATLKNFQIHYATHEWAKQRASWRAVIYLNLLRNVILVLDLLLREMSLSNGDRRPSPSMTSDGGMESSSHAPAYRFIDKHRLLKLRLAPLRRVQADLEKRLGPGSLEIYSTTTNTASPFDSIEGQGQDRPPELGVNSTNGWRSVLEKLRLSSKGDGSSQSAQRCKEEESDEVTDVLVGCKDDMNNLWEDSMVQQILTHRKSKIEDSPGFFMNDIKRIASYDYEPSDDDIVRARLRTVGVQEHRFVMEEGSGKEWLMYDLGGTRSSRVTWASYFDDANAIIFLCPISCFDEQLREERTVNRLEDSYQLWCSICNSAMLVKAQLILFLNKCDLLHNKLQRGTFGDRENDTVTDFQSHFKEISRVVSPEPRPLYIHFTSVIDTKATATTLRVVEESILRSYFKSANLL
ncbi:guanine nucleotide binding protein, alpha subunit [Melanogaster broomeanus]|nr:guanine nucleotide binding protein, alpha subunit [Melanogaster broomeanus]